MKPYKYVEFQYNCKYSYTTFVSVQVCLLFSLKGEAYKNFVP